MSKSEGSRPRTLLIKMTSKEDRNLIISGLRMILTKAAGMSMSMSVSVSRSRSKIEI